MVPASVPIVAFLHFVTDITIVRCELHLFFPSTFTKFCYRPIAMSALASPSDPASLRELNHRAHSYALDRAPCFESRFTDDCHLLGTYLDLSQLRNDVLHL